MKRTKIAGIATLAALLTTAGAVNSVKAQPPQLLCLHAAGETQAEATRRQEAIRVMRAINTAQARAFATTRAYLNFREVTALGLPSRPVGFLLQLTVESSVYGLLLRDTADPCGYALFSDQDGVIYAGSPLR